MRPKRYIQTRPLNQYTAKLEQDNAKLRLEQDRAELEEESNELLDENAELELCIGKLKKEKKLLLQQEDTLHEMHEDRLEELGRRVNQLEKGKGAAVRKNFNLKEEA